MTLKRINSLPSNESMLLAIVGACLIFLHCSMMHHQFFATQRSAVEDALHHVDGGKRHVRRPSRPITFVPTQDLQLIELFAASWWQSLPRFLKMNATRIQSVEEDVFVPVQHTAGGRNDVRMAVDWLDFCVEHLSKWWKNIDNSGRAFAIGKLQAYIERVMSSPADSTLMNSTIAVVPYGVSMEDKLEQSIWGNALEATIVGLVRQGIARVLVVGYYDADSQLAAQAFQNLLRFQENETNTSFRSGKSFSVTAGGTELAYVTTTDVKTEKVQVNVPKGALKGLHDAFKKEVDENVRKEWLGSSPERFKYVFLTEADQIIHARLSKHALETMDHGGVLIPHRLQPIPHPLDLSDVVEDASLLLPEDGFDHVHELGYTDSCCDTTDKTGAEDFDNCGNFWWLCGFTTSSKGNHTRLASYSFMRLTSGTGFVSLAATAHGRKCVPNKNVHSGCPSSA